MTRIQHTPVLRIIPAVAWMVIIFYLSSQSTVPNPPGLSVSFAAIVGHIVTFGMLALLLLYGLSGFVSVRAWHYVLAFALTLAYGLGDEIHQSFVPGRNATIFDTVMDAVGASLALFAAFLIDHLRSP